MIKADANSPGIFSWFGFDLPMAQRLSLIKQAGFGTTSLWWGEQEGCVHESEKKQVTDLVRNAGLWLENIHVPFDGCNDLWHPDRSVRERIVRTHIGWLEDCARYGIPIMVLHITKGADAPPDPAQEGIDSLAHILKAAEDLNVVMAIENTRRLDYLNRVLSELVSPCLGFCYDSSHDWLYSECKTALLGKWGHRLVAVHLSDNDGREDRHWLPGKGIIDWTRIRRALRDYGYSGPLTLEIFSTQEDHEKTPESFLGQAYEKVQWLKTL